MRKVFKIAASRFVRDLSGEGARIHGARWNRKGTPVVYTAESRSLAALECLVHVSLPDLPRGLRIVCIGIPDKFTPREIAPDDLPKGWRSDPAPFTAADFGSRWAANKESLLLRVPSVVVPHEFNLLINPLHPDIKFVSILEEEDFVYDERIFKAK